jgi:predicted site-specific integrase-resolvase
MAKTIQSRAFAVDERTAADLLGISPSTLRRWRRTGRGPRAIKLSRLVRYRPADLQRFLRGHVAAIAVATRSIDARAGAVPDGNS